MGQIATLYFDEPVRLDSDKLHGLYSQLGPAGAENVICRAMEELAVRLSDLAPMHRSGRLTDLAKLAHGIGAIGEQVGMSALARISGDVCYCAYQQDETALAATLFRLERVGERSLTEVWDQRDLSI